MDTKNAIEEIERTLSDYKYGLHPTELYEPITYILSLGGKRIRPLLTLLAYNFYNDNYQSALLPACAVEVFHNFTLMHDDIMDEAPLRRGKSTVHTKWDNNLAILSGDVMMVKSYDMLLEAHEIQDYKYLVKEFNKCARGVCEGQQLDMNFEQRSSVSVEEYIEMIRLKTAVLLGFSLKLGGILANASFEEQQQLEDIGITLGIGFQLKDDLLDVFGDSAKVGKQVGGDIIANKKTFLLITALNQATGPVKNSLEKWIAKEHFDEVEKVNAVKEIYESLSIEAQTKTMMQTYFDKGLKMIEQLPVNKSKKQPLVDLTNMLIHRDK